MKRLCRRVELSVQRKGEGDKGYATVGGESEPTAAPYTSLLSISQRDSRPDAPVGKAFKS